jgi:DNA replication protein DnaC
MKCYAESYCKKPKTECNELCGGYRVLRALYRLSRIPVAYQYSTPLTAPDGDVEAFIELNNYKENVVDHVEAGEGLYIWSRGTGNGKTSWACKIMGYYFRKIAFSSGLENEGLYIYLPTFLEDLRASYDANDNDFKEVLDMVKSCKLLIIDDIGAERVTEWVRERLVSLINTRVSAGLCTIYTSNLSPADLQRALGDRIASRVMGASKEVQFVGADRRVSND